MFLEMRFVCPGKFKHDQHGKQASSRMVPFSKANILTCELIICDLPCSLCRCKAQNANYQAKTLLPVLAAPVLGGSAAPSAYRPQFCSGLYQDKLSSAHVSVCKGFFRLMPAKMQKKRERERTPHEL